MDDLEDTNGKKRRLSSDDETDLQKRKVFREEIPAFGLLDFSDEILMLILQCLDSAALISLSRTCSKLQDLASDKTLWAEVDLSYEPMTGEEIRKLIFKDVCRFSEIRSLTIRGLVSLHPVDKWKNQTVTATFLEQIGQRCPHLERITITEACLDISKVTIISFPQQLRHFSVDRCEIICTEKRTNRRHVSFFSSINTHLKDLERLFVENCNWFDTHDLIAFSKLPTLKELSLRGCNSFKECVPYGSIATRFGFRTLEVLDVRNTPVTDSDIQCFNMTKSLKELRLQCPEPAKEKTGAEESQRTTSGDGAGPSSSETSTCTSTPSTSTTASASNSPSSVQPPPPPPPPQPQVIQLPAEHPIERQVINLHLRRVERGQNEGPNDAGAAPVAEVVREDADGAEIQAGNNNVRINIRNQNVQGRHVIHIAIRNSHNCNRNQENNGAAAAAGPNNNQPQPDDAPDPNPNPNPNPDPLANQNRDQANNEANNAPPNDPAEANNNNDQANAARPPNNEVDHEQGAQHYIMIRGFRDDEGDEFNPARIVQFIQFERSFPIGLNAHPTTLITDRGICSFGQSGGNQPGVIWIRMENRSTTTSLERIIVRDYKYVTDNSLQHLSSCAPHLKFLDVIGTEVTKIGIEKFKLQKPECHVISNYGVFA